MKAIIKLLDKKMCADKDWFSGFLKTKFRLCTEKARRFVERTSKGTE